MTLNVSLAKQLLLQRSLLYMGSSSLWWVKHAHLNLWIMLFGLINTLSCMLRRLLRWWWLRCRWWSFYWHCKVVLLRNLRVLFFTTIVWYLILCSLSEEPWLWVWWARPFSLLLISIWVEVMIYLPLVKQLLSLLSSVKFRSLQLWG